MVLAPNGGVAQNKESVDATAYSCRKNVLDVVTGNTGGDFGAEAIHRL